MAIGKVADASKLNSVANTSLVINKPAGVANGDILIAAIGGIAQGTITAPAGWTALGTQLVGTQSYIAAFTRVVDGSEGSTFTWTVPSAKACGWIGGYSGPASSSPVASAKDSSTSAGTFFVLPDVAVSSGGWLISAVVGRHTATGSATTFTSSDAGDASVYTGGGSNGGSGNDIGFAVFDSNAPLTTGTYHRSLSSSQTENQQGMYTITITPQTPPAGLTPLTGVVLGMQA